MIDNNVGKLTVELKAGSGGALQSKSASASDTEQKIVADSDYYGLKQVTIAPALLQDKSASIRDNEQVIRADDNYYGLHSVTVPAVKLQSKHVSVSNDAQVIVADDNYNGLADVTIDAVKLQSKTVSVSTTTQTITADNTYNGLSSVVVNALKLESVSAKPSTSYQYITPSTGYDALSNVSIDAVKLQDKEISVVAGNTAEILADSDYFALNKVTVAATLPDSVYNTSDATAKDSDVASGAIYYNSTGKHIGTAKSGKYNMLFDTQLVDLTDDDLPVAKPGTLTLNGSTNAIQSITSEKIGTVSASALEGRNNLASVNLQYATELGANAFSSCTNLTSLIVPQVKNLDSSCLQNCHYLKTVDFSNVEDIGQYALYYAMDSGYNTVDITLPKCKTLDYWACKNWGNTSSSVKVAMTLPLVETIGTSAFEQSGITKLDLGPTATSIGSYILALCTKITTLICRATTPPTLDGDLYYTFSPPKNIKIYVPDEAVDAYKSATNWSQYSSVIKPLSEYVET